MTNREDLMKLQKGMIVELDGEVYEVAGIGYRDEEGVKGRTDVSLLKPGAERYSYKPGRFHAAGKTLRFDNAKQTTIYAGKKRGLRILEVAVA